MYPVGCTSSFRYKTCCLMGYCFGGRPTENAPPAIVVEGRIRTVLGFSLNYMPIIPLLKCGGFLKILWV